MASHAGNIGYFQSFLADQIKLPGLTVNGLVRIGPDGAPEPNLSR